MNYDPNKYFMNFPMAHLTAFSFPAELCIDFYSGNTVDLDMKDIGRRRITSRELTNSHFPTSFSCACDLLSLSETSTFRSTDTIPYLDQSVLI